MISEHRGFDYLHTNYGRGGYSGSFNNAIIKLKNEDGSVYFSFGRSSVLWGRGIDLALLKA